MKDIDLETVSSCQDVPECELKLCEVHLMASSQQSLWRKNILNTEEL